MPRKAAGRKVVMVVSAWGLKYSDGIEADSTMSKAFAVALQDKREGELGFRPKLIRVEVRELTRTQRRRR